MNLEKAQARRAKAEQAVYQTFEPTQAQWNELDAAVTECRAMERRKQDKLAAAKAQKRRDEQAKLEAKKRLAAELIAADCVRRFRNAMIVGALLMMELNNAQKERDA